MGGEVDGVRSHLSGDEAAAEMGHPKILGEARGAQTFVGTLASVWRRPWLTGLEVAWRWAYGVPALVLVWSRVKAVLLAATGGTLDPGRLGLDKALLNDPVGALSADPLGAAGKFAGAAGLVWPGVEHAGAWVVPVVVVWVAASAMGRTLVLRRADGRLQSRVMTVMGLQAIRVGALAVVCGAWFGVVRWCSGVAVGGPVAAGREPNLVGWFAMVIVATLGIFTGWGFVSWVFTAAPLMAMQEGLGVGGSLQAALRTGSVRGKLVEVNLVLAVVKIALIVLAMVFSATPLPFESVTTPEFLRWWWAGVAVVYLVWSDFFHVARLVGYLEFLSTGQSKAQRRSHRKDGIKAKI